LYPKPGVNAYGRFRWHFGQKWVERPARVILTIAARHRGHGSPVRAYTLNSSWNCPLSPEPPM
jgi:hypothetical protein